MTAPGPAPGGIFGGPDDAERWQEAARLRGDHRGWSVIWLAAAGEFHARKRLAGARRDTALAAATAAGLDAQITAAEQAAPATRHPKDPT